MAELPDPIVIRTNDDWDFAVRLRQFDPDGNEVAGLDISGVETRLTSHVRQTRAAASVFMTLSTDNGRLVKTENAAEGEYAYNVAAATIAALLPPGDYITDLVVEIDGKAICEVERQLVVEQGVTR